MNNQYLMISVHNKMLRNTYLGVKTYWKTKHQRPTFKMSLPLPDIWMADYKMDSQGRSDHLGQVTLDPTEH